MLSRVLEASLREAILADQKVVILFGPRQVGKTTLLNHILDSLEKRILRLNVEEARWTEDLASRDLARYRALFANYDLVFIDEAQHIPQVGLVLKLIHDHLPQVKLVVSGSSAFSLSQTTSEPLTGRKWTFTLLPISFQELALTANRAELTYQLAERLVWGSYPELFNLESEERREHYLLELSSDYLYKDVLALADVRGAEKIRQLLRLLAYQVGSLVSFTELGAQLGMSKETVARYLDLLEKAFVIYRLGGFSRNLRKEITKQSKYYFFDLGIRNILIEDLKPFAQRGDQGQLWENFLVVERLKKNLYQRSLGRGYFWRVYTGGEIDYIESAGRDLAGYEFKLNKTEVAAPPSWTSTYPEASWSLVNRANFLDFIL